MLDSYHMFPVHALLSLLLGASILFYRFVSPKKKLPLMLILILFLLLPLISLLRKGSYESGELTEHAKVAYSFIQSLQEGNILPQWSEKACSSYGCPLFIFQYPLPYYVIAIFNFLGFSLLASTKILLGVSFLFSGISMYVFAKDLFGKVAGFTGAILYGFAPYHLITLHHRAAIGETLSFVFIPLLFLFAKKVLVSDNRWHFFAYTLSVTAIVLSHHVTALFSLPLVWIYTVLLIKKRTKKKKSFVRVVFSNLLGCGLAAFFIFPVFLEGNSIQQGTNINILFQPFWYHIFSPLSNRFGMLLQGNNGESYMNIGYVHLFIIGVSGFYFLRDKIIKAKSIFVFTFVSCLFLLFLLSKTSRFLWEFIPFISYAGFSFRVLVEIAFLTALLGAILTTTVKNRLFFIAVCFLAVSMTILNWGNRRVVLEITDTYLKKTALYEEDRCRVELTTPKWVDTCSPWIGKKPQKHIEFLSGKGTIKELMRKSTHHQYILAIEKSASLKENTYYFPGWKLFINNKEVAIDYSYKNFQGLMIFHVPKGLYRVDFIIESTFPRFTGQMITIASFFTLVAYSIFPLRKKYG